MSDWEELPQLELCVSLLQEGQPTSPSLGVSISLQFVHRTCSRCVTQIDGSPAKSREVICALVCFLCAISIGYYRLESNATMDCAAGSESYGVAVCKRRAVAACGGAHAVEGAVRCGGRGNRAAVPACLSPVDPLRRGPGDVCIMRLFLHSTPQN